MPYTYRFQIDFGHAGDYSHALADVTAYVRTETTLTVGCQDPYATVAGTSSFNFTLFNGNKAFSPDITTAPYYGLLSEGTLVKVTATYAGSTVYSWFGKIAKILPYVNPNVKNAADYVNVVVEDFMPELTTAQIFPELQTDVAVHDALITLMESAAARGIIPYESYWWVLDVTALGTAKFPDTDIFTYSESASTIPYLGDNAAASNSTVGVMSMIKDIMNFEFGGRFFWNGSQFEFQDRYFGLTNVLAGAALTLTADDIERVDYRKGGELGNDVDLTYQPRQVGTPATVIYSSERTLSIGAYESRTVQAHFRDPDNPNARIGATDIINLALGTDVIANNAEDGSGTDLSAWVSVSQENRAQSAKITITNTLSGTVYITTLQLRGTPIYTYERETVNAVDAQSVNDNRRKQKTLTHKLVADEETAQGMANIFVARFKDPIARFHTVTYLANSNAKLAAYVPTVGDYIYVSEQKETKHVRDYILTGYVVRVNKERECRVTLTLSPIAREQYWILGVEGYSELDTTAIVAL